MTWLTPTAGIVLGAIVIPILLLLYFLRLRRQPLQIASTLFWEKAVEDLHANSPFQRLRPSLLFILQLLALIFVIVALMQPQVEGGSLQGGRHVILIDQSGSMTTIQADGVSRLDEAKRQAIELVHQIHGGGLFASHGGETMVISFSDHAQIVAPFSDAEQQLVKAIESIQPTHGRSSIADALKLARAYTTNVNPEQAGMDASESAQLELFSDGQIFDIAKQALQRGESLRYHEIGSVDTSNVGIATISAKRISETSDDVQVFLTLINTGSSEVETDIEISINGIPIGVQGVTVPPRTDKYVGKVNVVFVPFSIPQSGIVQAALTTDDPYLIDNVASLVIPPPKELRVILTEEGAPIVRTILEGMALAELRQVDAETLKTMITSGEAALFDVIVSRGISLETMPRGHYLVFGAPPPLEAFSTYIDGKAQVMLVAHEEHPVMRFVRYENIVVTEGHFIVVEAGVETLLEGSGWPAVMSYKGDGVQLIYVAFDPINSNWPYLRSFPFFVYNAVQYLGRSGDILTAVPRQVGQSISHEVAFGITSVQIEEPNGKKHTVDVDQRGRVSWGPIRLSGLHKISWGEGLGSVVAINSPQEESMIASVDQISIGATTIESSKRSGISFVELWPWALGIVLAVLIAEWWVYQRKVGGFGRRYKVTSSVGKGG